MAPPRSRKRGPILFGWAVALIALALGTLGVIDVLGAEVPISAYPATALAVVAVTLVLSSIWGRGGGLILLGLLLLPVLGVSTLVDRIGDSEHRQHLVPLSAALVEDRYRQDVGEIVLDLTRVSNPADLDGREITVSQDVGRIEVIVPRNITVDVRADVHGFGSLDVLGHTNGGVDVTMSVGADRGAEPPLPEISLNASVDVGRVVVRQVDPKPDATAPSGSRTESDIQGAMR